MVVRRSWSRVLVERALRQPPPAAADRQLSLPFCGAWQQCSWIPLGTAPWSGLELIKTDVGLQLRLVFRAWPAEEHWIPESLRADPGTADGAPHAFESSPAECSASIRVVRPAHALLPDPGDPTFLSLLRLVDFDPGETTPAVAKLLEGIARTASDVRRVSLRALATALLAAARHLRQLADPDALEASRIFSSDGAVRWFVYETLANDETGRTRQLIDVCPGVVIAAGALCDSGCSRLARVAGQLLEDIRRGRRLGRLLDRAAEGLQQLAETPARWRGYPRAVSLKAPAGSPPPRRPRCRVETLRQLIRRAGPGVSYRALNVPWPAGVVPADVPSDPQDNARWYALFGSKLFAHAAARLDSEQVCSLAGFLSKSWRVFAPVERRLDAAVGDLCHLVDYLAVSGRRPGRRSDPDKLRRECQRWTMELSRRRASELDPQTRIAFDELPEWEHGRFRIAPIRTVGQLIDEGQRMQHCVAAWAREATERQCRFFRAEIEADSLTVMTTGDRALTLLEVTGWRNRLATEVELAVIERWQAAMQRILRAAPGEASTGGPRAEPHR